MTVAALIVAAGRGTRAGGEVPKQWRRIGGMSLAERAMRVFDKHLKVDNITLVLNSDDTSSTAWPKSPPADLVTGGATRTASVRAGLEALEGRFDHVLIHDAARPLVAPVLIDRVLAALETHPGAAPGLPVTDTLWQGAGGKVTGTQARDGLFRAQTPQGFRLADILAAHRAHAGEATDDVAIALAAGLDIAIVEGDERNLKITTAEDFGRAEAYLRQTMDIRTGSGFDVHAFGAGDHVMLCGIAVPHERGLVGHSDADVGMHALTDAIYGALAEGDIGRHFPPSDPQWKGAASETFLVHAVTLARKRGFGIGNCDVTLICERPKIAPHATDMQDKLAAIMGLEPGRISVKATTSERLGFTGREEGIAAMATATLVAP